MPLKSGSSQGVISSNIATEKHAHPDMPVKQAAAIAYSNAREGKDENENHDPKNGQFASGGGSSKGEVKQKSAQEISTEHWLKGKSGEYGPEKKEVAPAEQKYKTSLNSESGRKAHRTIAEAFNSGKSMKLGNYNTDGKAIYLHGNKIVEKGENGEINFTLAGWPSNTTHSSLRDFGINVSTSGGSRGGRGGKQTYTHSGGSEEIDPNKTYRAKDEQPQSLTAPSSGTPFKGRNLDDDPVGDRSASADCASTDAAVWPGRTL